MGPYVLVNTALAGFFAFAALHYACQWWLSRRETTFWVFALHCVFCGILSGYRVAIASATTLPAMETVLSARTTFGMLITATSVCLLSRLTGVRARRYVNFIVAFCLVAATVNAFVFPLNGTVTRIDRVAQPWGEVLSFSRRGPGGWWMAPLYAVVVSVYVFGMFAALRLWARDRMGGVFVALASGGGLLTIGFGMLTDLFRVNLPYGGGVLQIVSVTLIALMQSRDYKQRGELLVAGERRFRAIFEQTFQFIGLLAVDGTLLEANRTALDFAGIRAEDVIGKPFWDTPWWLHSPQLQVQLRQAVAAAARGEFVRLEVTHPAADGTIHHVDFSLKPVRDESGSVVMLIPEGRDVTDRKRAEETLRESEARYRTLVEFAPEAILVLDMAKGIFVDVNENACRMFKLPRDELFRRGPLDLSPPLQADGRASAEKARQPLEQALAGECVRVEWICRDGSGRDIPCEISLVRLPSVERPLIRGSVIDMSQTRQLEAQVRQAQKLEAVGKLAGGVAHDFNNLLTIIIGYAEGLLERLPPGDRLRESPTAIIEAGERAASLTRQLLAFSRQQVLQPKALNLNSVISKTETMLRRLIGADVILTTDLDPKLGIVKADPSQLEQVLMNLAVNSRDAMPKGGKLTIETRNVVLDEAFCRSLADVQAGPYSRLAVADSGIGMDEATRARAFEPFFTTKEPGKGTGLGLATVHGIVNQSGGHVEVFSKLSAGTTVKIYLPQIELAPAVEEPEPAARVRPHGSETVLLVEDEEGVRALGQHTLKSCGYAILEAKDGNQAIEVASAHAGAIDLLVSDLVMPHLGGKQLAERITALRPACKVLFLSGYTADAVIRDGVGESEFEFLQKPFTPALLAKKVREVLDRDCSASGT